MARPFLSIWLGERFPDQHQIDEMAAVLMILSVGHGLWLTQHSSFVVLFGMGYHRIFGVLATAAVVVCGTASLLSILVFDTGLRGIAWSCSLTMVAIAVLGVGTYSRQIMRVSARETLREVWLPALRGTFLAVVALVAWNRLALPSSWIELVCGVGVVGVIAVVGAWFLSLSRSERARFKRLARIGSRVDLPS
jgi:prepilin signal peptidase PulO-like enzyme (type II secretory pathway)